MDTRDDLVRIGQTLRLVRERQGISVAELATRTCIDAQQIRALEAGQLDPALEVIAALTEGLHIRLSTLFSND